MKNNNYEKIYQLKIVLEDIKPTIWRRIQVPENYTFWDLHVAIQDAMGWCDCHLNQFETISVRPREIQYIGIPDDEYPETETLPEWEEKISDWFSLDKRKTMRYNYDFGDNWDHKVTLEKILPKEEKTKYPICIAGARACPPEDCGGIGGYDNLLEIINNSQHEEYEETMEWLGGKYDPEEFNPKEVWFDNPKKRLKELFSNK